MENADVYEGCKLVISPQPFLTSPTYSNRSNAEGISNASNAEGPPTAIAPYLFRLGFAFQALESFCRRDPS